MNKDCPGCVAKDSEIAYLRNMVHIYANNQTVLIAETLIPKVQTPQAMPFPSVVNDNGQIVKMDQPDKPSQEAQFGEIDIVNEVMGH